MFWVLKTRLIETILLNETVLLSTHNICFGREIKKIVFQYALLSGDLYIYHISTYSGTSVSLFEIKRGIVSMKNNPLFV